MTASTGAGQAPTGFRIAPVGPVLLRDYGNEDPGDAARWLAVEVLLGDRARSGTTNW